MITYFHTSTYIFAVTNGYCSAVLDERYEVMEDHRLIASRVEGAVIGNEFSTIIPVEEIARRPDGSCRLRFEFGNSPIHTDFILKIESMESLGTPPSRRIDRNTLTDVPVTVRYKKEDTS